jgi:hypothetical protein
MHSVEGVRPSKFTHPPTLTHTKRGLTFKHNHCSQYEDYISKIVGAMEVDDDDDQDA